jgi:hypothetical protein
VKRCFRRALTLRCVQEIPPIPPPFRADSRRSARTSVGLLGAVSLAVFFFLASVQSVFPKSQPKTAQYESAEQCRKCHLARYNEWKESAHSKSAPGTNPLFAKLYEESKLVTKGETKEHCARCHAPVAGLNGDIEFTLSLTNEGINCDVCHTISETSAAPGNWPFAADPGPLKRGPYDTGKPKGHKIAKSALFTGSLICLGCHGGTSGSQGPTGCSCPMTCDTQAEWRKSPYPDQGSDCESCHMKKDAKGKQRLHFFEGVQNGDLLKSAADVRITTSDSAGKLNVFIDVTNSGTGHFLPTGPPIRMVYLKVEAQDESGKTLWSNFKKDPLTEDRYSVFMLTLADSAGKVPALPWSAVRIAADTRLEPMKKAALFFRIPRSGVKKIVATLYYRPAPLSLLGELGIADARYLEPKVMAKVSKELTAPASPDRFSKPQQTFPESRKEK